MCDRHIHKYGDTVSEIIQQHKAKERAIKKQIKSINEDIDEIQNFEDKLLRSDRQLKKNQN